ncbi:unnamed protein product [Trichogramma brassicae]|uniref:Chaoptin n=1 Tax=Trichogramma brassicae TaxID=86971 RepID=A0A6H5HZY3_9HYME|nr:unnamed protein product [Trichogramma brassicae]
MAFFTDVFKNIIHEEKKKITFVCILRGVSSSLRSLDLSYNSLEEIPLPALRGLRKLNWLNMHSNHLTTLEGDWGYVADTLSNAFFGDNSISAVPRSFSTFAALVWLNLDNNNMADLPEGVLPPNLVTLSLNLNLFESMPRSLASLAFLNWLYMRGNDIRRLELPQFASQELEMLDVSDNSIESISFSPGNNTLRIKDLNLSGNRLRSLARDSFARVLVRRIHLSSNGMRSIDDGAFLGLEDSLEYLNLENNELGQLPGAVSSLHELAYLYLANNQIRELNNVSFAEFTSNLKALSLASNQLQVVPTNSLVGCSNLLHLNLGYNKIHKVEPGDFDWASSLEILLLRNNVLTQLKAQTFRGASKLKELSLSFNHLSDLSEETFVGLEDSLEILELSFAFSTDVFPQRALRPLSSLHWLVLDNNNFHAIEPTAFYTFQQLRYINLESNRLHYLPERIFLADVHAELRDVKLGYNFLESIPESTFHNLTELRALDLTGNKIRSLAADSVRNCPKLVTLSLANNRISSLDSAAFVALYGLRFLHLELNKLTALDFETFADRRVAAVGQSSGVRLRDSLAVAVAATLAPGIPSDPHGLAVGRASASQLGQSRRLPRVDGPTLSRARSDPPQSGRTEHGLPGLGPQRRLSLPQGRAEAPHGLLRCGAARARLQSVAQLRDASTAINQSSSLTHTHTDKKNISQEKNETLNNFLPVNIVLITWVNFLRR